MVIDDEKAPLSIIHIYKKIIYYNIIHINIENELLLELLIIIIIHYTPPPSLLYCNINY